MATISVDYWNGQPFGNIKVDKMPDECGVCHYGIEPIYKVGVLNLAPAGSHRNSYVQAVFVCPRSECRNVLIAYYTQLAVERDSKARDEPPYRFLGIKPRSFLAKEFPAIIKEVSPLFCTIYNEAAEAEDHKLSNITGPGYRKALEFLVKDYLISENKAAKDEIEENFLGMLIKTKIPDRNLQQCAERAAWLGNDESHYRRTWGDKDITDLKRLITLCVNWIENHLLTKEYVKKMPQP